MTVWEDCEDAHSRRTRFLRRSDPLTGLPGPHVLSSRFGLPAFSRTSPPTSQTVRLCASDSHHSNLLSDLSGESNKNCLLRWVNESNRVLDVCSLGRANSLRLQMSGSDGVHRSQVPLITSTMAENGATPFPFSVGGNPR